MSREELVPELLQQDPAEGAESGERAWSGSRKRRRTKLGPGTERERGRETRPGETPTARGPEASGDQVGPTVGASPHL